MLYTWFLPPDYNQFKLRHEIKIHSFETYNDRIVSWKIVYDKEFIQTIMFTCIANFLIDKKIRYKNFEIRYFSPVRDSKSICYNRKFVLFEFVITVKFCKYLLKINFGDSTRHPYIRDFATYILVLNNFYCICLLWMVLT